MNNAMVTHAMTLMMLDKIATYPSTVFDIVAEKGETTLI